MISRKQKLRFTCVLVPLLLMSGCAANGTWLRNIEHPLRMNQPELALQALEQSAGNIDDAALYLVNKGILLRMAGDTAGSIEAFEAAKPLITFQEATSISDVASTLTLNEGSDGYQPPPFEQVQMHFYQALNRIDMGDWEAARIEAMQIDILLERRWEGQSPFGSDAAARFLTGLIFEANGEQDNALIAYRKAYNSYKDRDVAVVPGELQRRLLVLTRRSGLHDEFDTFAVEFGDDRKDEALAIIKDASKYGELVLIASTGLIPHRFENRATHMDPASGKIFTLALPGLSQPENLVSTVSLWQGSKALGRADLFVDLSELSRHTLDDELPGLVAKAIARNVIKNVGANQVEEQFGFLGGLVANVAAAATEAADVRCWSTLPQHIQVVSTRLQPGTYTDISVEYQGLGGSASHALGREVRIAAGTPTVISVHRVSP